MKKVVESFKNFASLLLQDFINFIHFFDGFDSDKEIRKYAKELRKTGIITIENYVSAEECDKIRQKIIGLAQVHSTTTKLGNGTYVDYRSEKNNTGADHGMIDIYNIDRSVDEVNKIDTLFMFKVLKATVGKQKVYLPRISAYLNRSVTGTRGYHIDNTQPVAYKGFIYLTDVTDDSYGPYAIIKGSQRFSIYVYWNLFRNIFISRYKITDMPVVKKKKEIHVTGRRGTLIISNQNAMHRGMPQEPGKERCALVYVFLAISKLNYIHSSTRELFKEAEASPNRKM